MRIEIDEELAGQRLDRIIADASKLGRGGVKRLFDGEHVSLVTGSRRTRAKKGWVARLGTVIEIDVDSTDLARADPDPAVELIVALETPALVIVDKPAGMASAPVRPGERGAVANGLVARYPEMKNVGFSPREPGLCHRLDTGTSGLLLAARTRPAFEALTSAIRSGEMDKRYLLICKHAPLENEGTIDRPLRTEGPRVHVDPAGRPASTRYVVLRRAGELALVEARACPATRHQIRVHFASLGAPLLGDALYGGDTRRLDDRHALHASRLGHGRAFDVKSPFPKSLQTLL